MRLGWDAAIVCFCFKDGRHSGRNFVYVYVNGSLF